MRKTKTTGATPKALVELAPGVTLRELSRRTGIRVDTLSKIVNGKRGLTLSKAMRIAAAVNTTIEHVHVTLTQQAA